MSTSGAWCTGRRRGQRDEFGARESPQSQLGAVAAEDLRGGSAAVSAVPQPQSVDMRLVSVIQAPTVIDGILAHLQKIGGNDPHEGTAQRGPPAFDGLALTVSRAERRPASGQVWRSCDAEV